MNGAQALIRTLVDSSVDVCFMNPGTSEMHFVHALALIAVGIVSAQFGRKLLIDLAGAAFLVGIILFCGGIYAAFGPEATAAKPLIPLGGASFMLGWVLFAAGAFFLKRN